MAFKVDRRDKEKRMSPAAETWFREGYRRCLLDCIAKVQHGETLEIFTIAFSRRDYEEMLNKTCTRAFLRYCGRKNNVEESQA
jgi:hypothetical protein